MKLTPKISSKSCSRMPSRFVGATARVIPALFTRMSRPPNSATVAATMARTWASSATSAFTTRARAPPARNSAPVSSASCCERE